MKKRKTLSAMIMTLFLGLVSCNSSGTVAEESPQSRFLKSVISLGNDFLNVFTSFGDMVGGVLGLILILRSLMLEFTLIKFMTL